MDGWIILSSKIIILFFKLTFTQHCFNYLFLGHNKYLIIFLRKFVIDSIFWSKGKKCWLNFWTSQNRVQEYHLYKKLNLFCLQKGDQKINNSNYQLKKQLISISVKLTTNWYRVWFFLNFAIKWSCIWGNIINLTRIK